MIESPNIVDLAFPITGASVPLDHGYALFGALSRLLPWLREKPDWGVHPILGLRTEPGVLALRIRGAVRSAMKLRLPAEQIGAALPLAGARLELDGHTVSLGAPTVHVLTPNEVLRARIVTIRGFFGEPEPFADALRRQLAAVPRLDQDPERIQVRVLDRRVMRVRDRTVVGFRVQLEDLVPSAAIAVQNYGLGGRRHMGAGMFVPSPRSERR